jgi:hypothetical protein
LVSATYGVAGYHLLTLSYHILNGDIDVGEGGKEGGGELLSLLVALDVLIWFVPDELGA